MNGPTPDLIAERWNEVDRVYEEALAVAVGDRTGFLTDACAGDKALFDTVSRLLEASARGEEVLSALPADLLEAALGSSQSAGADREAAAALPAGTLLGPYRLLNEVKRGGMATVYKAERADGTFDRQVAVKMLDGVASEDLTRRFIAERRILSELSHPHIARILDGGTTDRGRPYLVMEWVEGERITRWADERRLDVRARLAAVQQVAEAVQYAHARLVVHRDIKPSNVLVDSEGCAHLLDFGIAKLLEPEVSGEPDTRTETRWMTPEYAAPEQLLGQPVTTATDVYALGVLLHELLTGRRPLEGEAPNVRLGLATGERTPPAMSAVIAANDVGIAAARATTPAGLRRALAGDLDAVISKALRRAPEERYASPRDLADDLARHLEARPVEARAGLRTYRLRRFVARNRAAVAAAVLAVAALVAGAGGALWQAGVARTEAARAGEVRDFMLRLFEGTDPALASGEDEVTVRALLDRAAGRIETELAGGPSLQAEMFTLLGSIHGRIGNHDVGRSMLANALDLHATHSGPGSVPHASATLELARVEHRAGDNSLASILYERARASFSETVGARSVEVGQVERDMARLAHETGRYQQADSLFSAARTKLEAGGVHESELLLLDLEHLGTIHTTSDRARIDSVLERVLANRHHLDDQRSLLVTGVLVRLGQEATYGGDPEGAEPLVRGSLDVRRAILGERHPDVARAMATLAATLQRLGRFDEALENQRTAVDILRSSLGPEHPDYAQELAAYAVLLSNTDAFGRAVELFAEVEQIQVAALGEGHLHVAMTRRNLGRSLMATDRHAEALPILEAGLASWMAAMGREGFYVPEVRLDLAMSLAATGRYAAADSLVELVLAGHRREPPRPGGRGHALLTRAQIHSARGEMAAAVTGAEAALASLDEDGVAPGTLPRARAELALGEYLITLGSLADAEPHLLSAYGTFGTLRGASGLDTSAVLRQLVRLYEAWERSAEAERFAALLQSATAGRAPAGSRRPAAR